MCSAERWTATNALQLKEVGRLNILTQRRLHDRIEMLLRIQIVDACDGSHGTFGSGSRGSANGILSQTLQRDVLTCSQHVRRIVVVVRAKLVEHGCLGTSLDAIHHEGFNLELAALGTDWQILQAERLVHRLLLVIRAHLV